MAQEIDNKLEELRALVAELSATDKYNIYVVVEDKKRAKTMYGLCGTIRDIKASLCYAFNGDINSFKIAVKSILTYTTTMETLKMNGELYNSILALMRETVAAREKEIQETNEDEDNG